MVARAQRSGFGGDMDRCWQAAVEKMSSSGCKQEAYEQAASVSRCSFGDRRPTKGTK
jgi:hypothetical protein